MNIAAFDLSLTATGFAYTHTDPDLAIATETIRSKQSGTARLDDLEQQLVGPMPAIDLVVIEGYSYGSRASQAHSLGELGGVVRLGLWRRGIPVSVVSPAARSKYATGKGNASKDAVIAAISARTGIAFRNSDECDAWILCAMALDYYGTPIMKMPAHNREALDAIEWPDNP